jgi:threonine synthase
MGGGRGGGEQGGPLAADAAGGDGIRLASDVAVLRSRGRQQPLREEGYKTLAYKITKQLGWHISDCCVLPVCYGDALIGMWRDFEEMLG